MNFRGIKKFILPLLVIIVLFFVFTSGGTTGSTGGTGRYPLALGEDIKSGSGFTNISRFGATPIDYTKYPDGTIIQVSNDLYTKTQPNGDPMSLDQYVLSLITNIRVLNNLGSELVMSLMGKTYKYFQTPSGDPDAFINTLTTDEKSLLTMLGVSKIKEMGSSLRKNLEFCSNDQSTLCKILLGYAAMTPALLNTDIIKGIPKVGSGWDEYTIQNADVTTETKLVITPSIDFSSKKIKAVVLKYRGKEKGSASEVIVSLDGKDNLGAPLPETESTDTSYSGDRQSFNYNFYCLPLKYPVTIDSLSIKLSCPGQSAAIDDASILFVYN